MAIQTINPATGAPIKTYEEMAWAETNKIIEATHQAFLQWRNTSFAERAAKINKVAKILTDNKEEYAKLITQEMGKPITAARFEIDRCIRVCKHFAEHAAEYLAPHHIKTDLTKSYVTYQPMGVIFAIMPWNFPFFQVFRFAAPGLMAGNAYILKHAPITTGCGLAIEKIFQAADLPANLFRTVIIDTDQAEKVIAHPNVMGVTLTGSVGAGKTVGAEAASRLKKVVLELGGSDPYLVLEDADLDLAAEQCVTSRLANAGQVCIAAKRLIVVDKVREAFEKKVIEKVQQYKTGNPMDESIKLGPLARADLRDSVHKQVQGCIAKGAELVMGGEPIAGPGFFYPATVLKNVQPGMPAYDDEIFGPVVAFIKAKDEQEAIKIANNSPFGLAAAVFTKDTKRGEEIAHQLEAGTCFVNQFVLSDPRLPFGGTKDSGFGRELAAEGIREFTNIKTIGVK
jgi:succinate-semialdehyde dehydrogenase / glutarate-semialdehyde dehydrogenase